MKILSLLSFFLILVIRLYGQTITGKVISASNNEPLCYASLGVIDTGVGTITDETGNFMLEIKGLTASSPVRISMIGYISRTYQIGDLKLEDNILQLENETYKLPEVIVNPLGKLKKAGTANYSFRNGYCGWRDEGYGMGYEVGTKIELGDSPVKLKSLHIRVNKQSFDSSLFRLHIRNITDNLPHDEMLNKNILIAITTESGWMVTDLSKYNLVFEGDIGLSLEWIKVIGVHLDRLVPSSRDKKQYKSVTFSVKQKKGCTYTKWGSEAKWNFHSTSSPSIYLTVQQISETKIK